MGNRALSVEQEMRDSYARRSFDGSQMLDPVMSLRDEILISLRKDGPGTATAIARRINAMAGSTAATLWNMNEEGVILRVRTEGARGYVYCPKE
jgi:hypothetical protein